MDIYRLAEIQAKIQGKVTILEIFDNMVKIRKWLDIHRNKTAEKILSGGDIYNYKNRIIVNNKGGYYGRV